MKCNFDRMHNVQEHTCLLPGTPVIVQRKEGDIWKCGINIVKCNMIILLCNMFCFLVVFLILVYCNTSSKYAAMAPVKCNEEYTCEVHYVV